MSRKPRSDCKPLKMSDENQQKVFTWIKLMGFEKARLLAIKDLGESFSIGSLHNAYGHWVQAESENRMLQAITGADAIIDAAAGNLPKLDQALEASLKQAAFEAALTNDNAAIKTLVGLVLKFKASDQDDRKIAMQERRLKQAEAAEAITKDEKLTPEQQAERMKQIFGIG
jgi:hypothetical protein